MKKTYSILLTFFLTASVFAQVSTNGGSGLATSYPSLASAITALNAATINSPVVITAAFVNETAPAGGYVITAQGTAVNSIQILSNGSVVTASTAHPAGSLTDAIFKLVGADYVTIKDWTIQENAANTIVNASTNNMTEWGIALLYASGTNGAQNNTLQGNTISLNKAYQNSFGIYSSTAHSSTDVTTLADNTAAGGNNDNLKIYGCTISNVNTPIAVISAPAFPGLGLDIGGSSAATANTLTDWGITANFTAFSRVAAAVTGILATNQIGANISYNNITSTISGNNNGALRGVFAATNGTLTYPASANTININNNTIALTSNVSTITVGNPLIDGILNLVGDANTTVNINYNNFTKIDNIALNATGNDTVINNAASAKFQNINYNQFTNLNFKNNGSNTSYVVLISHAGNSPAGAVQTSSYNSIVGTLTRTASAVVGTTYGIQCNGGTALLDVVHNWTYNNFSNVSITNGSFIAFYNYDGPTTGYGLNKNISYNTVSNINASGGVIGISVAKGSNGTGHLFRRNTLTNYTATANAASVVGITTNSGNNLATLTIVVDSNRVDNFSSLLGTFEGLTSTAAATTISNNTVTRLYGSSTNSCYGIRQSNGWNNEITYIYNNKVGNLENAGNVTGNSATFGIAKASNASENCTYYAYNNRVGDIRAPNATSRNAFVGMAIGINGSVAGLTNCHLFNNTIFLSGTTNAATSGSSCVHFPGRSPIQISGTTLNLRNNILVNLSTPGTESANDEANGVSACLRRITGIGGVPENYVSTSNNNLFWANPTAGTNNHLTYMEGWSATTITLKVNPLSDWQNLLSVFSLPMDNVSVTENVLFQSVNVMDDNFLMINPVYIQKVNNAGASITTPISVTTDFQGDARNANTPDIGADEYTQNVDAVVPVTLALLNGRKSGSDNLLNWSTYSEMNNSGFDVQRSANGISFVTIGTVASKANNGFSATRLDYNFADRNAPAGKFYYRLLQKDIDGKQKLSNIVMVSDKAISAGIAAIHPNPARNHISISINATVTDKVQFMITDVNGRMVKQQTAQVLPGSNSIGVDISKLAGGYYNVSIQLNELGKVVTERFIKQ